MKGLRRASIYCPLLSSSMSGLCTALRPLSVANAETPRCEVAGFLQYIGSVSPLKPENLLDWHQVRCSTDCRNKTLFRIEYSNSPFGHGYPLRLFVTSHHPMLQVSIELCTCRSFYPCNKFANLPSLFLLGTMSRKPSIPTIFKASAMI